eukprot:tig00021105_g18254.t1
MASRSASSPYASDTDIDLLWAPLAPAPPEAWVKATMTRAVASSRPECASNDQVQLQTKESVNVDVGLGSSADEASDALRLSRPTSTGSELDCTGTGLAFSASSSGVSDDDGHEACDVKAAPSDAVIRGRELEETCQIMASAVDMDDGAGVGGLLPAAAAVEKASDAPDQAAVSRRPPAPQPPHDHDRLHQGSRIVNVPSRSVTDRDQLLPCASSLHLQLLRIKSDPKMYIRSAHLAAASYEASSSADREAIQALLKQAAETDADELEGLRIRHISCYEPHRSWFQAALWAEDKERLFVALRVMHHDQCHGRLELDMYSLSSASRDFPGIGQVNEDLCVWADRVRLRPIIDAAHSKGKRLVLCGHSLGGAVACLVLARLLLEAARLEGEQGPDDPDVRAWSGVAETALCVTFGQLQLVKSDGPIAGRYSWDEHLIAFMTEDDTVAQVLTPYFAPFDAAPTFVIKCSEPSGSSELEGVVDEDHRPGHMASAGVCAPVQIDRDRNVSSFDPRLVLGRAMSSYLGKIRKISGRDNGRKSLETEPKPVTDLEGWTERLSSISAHDHKLKPKTIATVQPPSWAPPPSSCECAGAGPAAEASISAPSVDNGPHGAPYHDDELEASNIAGGDSQLWVRPGESIAAAVARATPGQTIRLFPGRYKEAILLEKEVHIVGSREAILEYNQGETLRFKGPAAPSVRGITIRGSDSTIVPDGEPTGAIPAVRITEGSRAVLEGCDVSCTLYSGIIVSGEGTSATLRGNAVHDCGERGISFHASAKGVAEDNDVFGNTRSGIAIDTGADPVVRGNKIRDGENAGIYVCENGRGTVEDNDIYGNALAGIQVSTGADPVVRGNKVFDGKSSGIFVLESGRGNIEDNDIYGNALAGIQMSTGADPAVRGNKVHDNKSAGIFVLESGRGTVEDNDIYSNALAGIAVQTGADPVVRGNKVHDNKIAGIVVHESGRGTVEDNDICGNALAGIKITTGADPVVRRNKVYDGKQGGIVAHESGQGTVEDNDIYGNALAGIEITTGADPVVRRNKVHDGKCFGIFVHESGRGTVEDNDIYGNALVGIAIATGADPVVRRNKVHDGKCDDCDVGILVCESGRGTVEDNDIYGNALGGIEITTGADPVVRRNKVHDGKCSGIFVHESGRGTVEDNDIYGNALVHDGKFFGIFVHESGRGTVEDNDIYGNALVGIEITTGADPVVRRNKVHDGKDAGIYVHESGRGTVEDNDIYGNALGGIKIATGAAPCLRGNMVHGGKSPVFRIKEDTSRTMFIRSAHLCMACYENSAEECLRRLLELARQEDKIELDVLSIQRTRSTKVAPDVFQDALWAEDRERLYVAFRGTDSFRDAGVDANMVQADVPGLGKVHVGFWKRACKVQLESIVYAAHSKGKRLVLCGHSLGGAVACLVLARLLLEAARLEGEQGPDDPDVRAWSGVAETALCVTFGQPLFADSQELAFGRYGWKDRVYAFAREDDPVPKLPLLPMRYAPVVPTLVIKSPELCANPSWPFNWFSYSETRCRYQSDSPVVVVDVDRRHGTSVRSNFSSLDLLAVSEHKMSSYLESICQITKCETKRASRPLPVVPAAEVSHGLVAPSPPSITDIRAIARHTGGIIDFAIRGERLFLATAVHVFYEDKIKGEREGLAWKGNITAPEHMLTFHIDFGDVIGADETITLVILTEFDRLEHVATLQLVKKIPVFGPAVPLTPQSCEAFLTAVKNRKNVDLYSHKRPEGGRRLSVRFGLTQLEEVTANGAEDSLDAIDGHVPAGAAAVLVLPTTIREADLEAVLQRANALQSRGARIVIAFAYKEQSGESLVVPIMLAKAMESLNKQVGQWLRMDPDCSGLRMCISCESSNGEENRALRFSFKLENSENRGTSLTWPDVLDKTLARLDEAVAGRDRELPQTSARHVEGGGARCFTLAIGAITVAAPVALAATAVGSFHRATALRAQKREGSKARA